MRRWVVLSMLLAGLLAPVPGAHAAPVVVAGPAEGGARVVVEDREDGAFCAGVRVEGDWEELEPQCEEPPDGPRRPALQTKLTDERGYVGGAVDRDVARVEVVLQRGRGTVGADTVESAAYRGREAGRIRFVLVVLPKDAAPTRVRHLAADGRVLAATFRPSGDAPDDEDEGDVERRRFAQGRIGGVRWTATASLNQELEPTLLEPERLETFACLSAHVGSGASSACAPLADADGTAVAVERSCDGSVAFGLVPAAARTVAVVRGDGRRSRGNASALPARYGARRAFAVPLGARVAVRRVLLLDGAGRVLSTEEVGLPPGVTECDQGIVSVGLASERPDPPPEGVDLPFVAEDADVALCARFGPPPTGHRRAGCFGPPAELDEGFVLAHRGVSSTTIAGVLSGDATELEVLLDGGQRLRVPAATDGGGYAGRYLGLVRFAVLSLPGRRYVERAWAHGPGRHGAPPRRRSVLPLDPGPPLTLARVFGAPLTVDAAPAEDGRRCLVVGTPAAGARSDACSTLTGVTYEARCAPRRLVLVGAVRRRSTVTAVLAGGRRVAAHVRSLPRRAGGGEVFRLVLGPRDELRAVRYAEPGRKPAGGTLRLPPAAEQCGYAWATSPYWPGGVIR